MMVKRNVKDTIMHTILHQVVENVNILLVLQLLEDFIKKVLQKEYMTKLKDMK